MTKNYKDHKVDKAFQVEDPGGRYYQVSITKENNNETLRFDEEGRIINDWDEARQLPGSKEDDSKN